MRYIIIIDGREITQGLMFLQEGDEFHSPKTFLSVERAMRAMKGHILENLPWRVYSLDYFFDRLFGEN